MSKYPICRMCGNAMVFTFAFRGCEYACLPCDNAVPMFNSLEQEERQESHMKAKKEKWSEELSIIGRRFGGGQCALCDDRSCELCKKTDDENYTFKYWKSRIQTGSLK